MSEPMLVIHNRHIEECGAAPVIDTAQSQERLAYFENSHGEQLIFTFDRESKVGIVRSGDAGWDIEYPVVDGVCDLALEPDEALWLAAVWSAATGQAVAVGSGEPLSDAGAESSIN